MIFDYSLFGVYLKIEADERKLKTTRGTTSEFCVSVCVGVGVRGRGGRPLSSGMLAGRINYVKLCEMFTQNLKTNMSKG